VSGEENCAGCRFSVVPSGYYRQCRRHAPHPLAVNNTAPVAADKNSRWATWPLVLNSDWCGEWEARRE